MACTVRDLWRSIQFQARSLPAIARTKTAVLVDRSKGLVHPTFHRGKRPAPPLTREPTTHPWPAPANNAPPTEISKPRFHPTATCPNLAFPFQAARNRVHL